MWRGSSSGEFVDYAVPARTHQTVLDVIIYIQRHLDPTLSYRYACRVGICGSCAMMVNGVPRWTCRTRAAGVLEQGRLQVAPLKNFTVVKDLTVDMTRFFSKLKKAQGFFEPSAPDSREFARIEPGSTARRNADAGIECIGCGVCYAACDVVAWKPDYLGPAALNRAWTLVNDERDAGHAARLKAVAGDAGCHACHSQQNCRQWCPKQLNPSAGIAGLKRATATAVLKRYI